MIEISLNYWINHIHVSFLLVNDDLEDQGRMRKNKKKQIIKAASLRFPIDHFKCEVKILFLYTYWLPTNSNYFKEHINTCCFEH